MGAELYVSLNAVKTHTRQLYRKLGATSRADAVARALGQNAITWVIVRLTAQTAASVRHAEAQRGFYRELPDPPK
jgi:Bacterial regulatory proteins, luxR family